MAKVSPVTGKPGYPGAGWFITTEYVDESYFKNFGAWHTGHDLAKSRNGGEPVYAVEDGVVKWAEFAGNMGFGNLITIQHPPDIYSRYGHLAEIRVQRGQNVTAGTIIGILGNTGRSTAPHLHFDIMRKNNALDWPGLNKARLFMEYINPTDWFKETVTIDTGSKPPLVEFLRIVAAAGINVRAQPSTSGTILNKLPMRTIIEVKRNARLNADGYFWRELTTGGWVAEAFTEALASEPTNPINPTPIDPPPAPPLPIIPVIPAAFALNIAMRGVHASAGGWAPEPDEINVLKANKPQAVMIVAYQSGQADRAIKAFRDNGVKDFIIRAAHSGTTTSNPMDFVNDTLPRLQEYQKALGTLPLILAVHNEPNVTREGWGSAWQDGAGFSRWYLQVVQAYRNALPGVKIGFPALSPGGDAPVIRMDEFKFAAGCVDAIAASDWVGVHAYFVGDGNDIDLKPSKWREMAQSRPIVITEGGPADGIPNNGAKLDNVYRKCAEAGFPVMAWLLSGAGAWGSAEWVKNNVRSQMV